MAGTVLILLLQSLGPFTLGYYYLALSEQMGRTYSIDWMFLTPSPYQSYRLTRDTMTGWTGQMYWATTGFVHGTAWLFLTVAAFYAPSSGRLRPASASMERLQALWKDWSQGSGALRRLHRSRLLEMNPYAWLVCRDRLKLTLVWMMLGGLGVVWFWAYLRFPEMMLDDDAVLLVMFIAHGLVKWWVCSEVCSRSVEDQRSGALELLLCTPVSSRSMVSGMGWAVIRQFGVPLAVIVVCDVVLLYFMQLRGGGAYTFLYFGWSPAPFCRAALFLLPLDLWAITWVAMRKGFLSKSVNRAMGITVFRILFLPYVISLVVYYAVFAGLHGSLFGRRSWVILWSQTGPYDVWVITCALVALISGWRARRGLASVIHQASLARYDRLKEQA